MAKVAGDWKLSAEWKPSSQVEAKCGAPVFVA